MTTRRALLLIADIGGYTEYMQFHRTMLGHAEAATTRLLEKVVDAARGFDLIEIEGDAAFLSREADTLAQGASTAAGGGYSQIVKCSASLSVVLFGAGKPGSRAHHWQFTVVPGQDSAGAGCPPSRSLTPSSRPSARRRGAIRTGARSS